MCSGYGGLDLAVMQTYPARLAWCADNDPHVAKILQTRFPRVPNHGDIAATDWTTVPAVDIVTAGFPCQDISYAGRGAGLTKETRSGLWFTIADALRLLRPALVIVENVPALRRRGLDQVLGDLASLGYDTAWCSVRACDIGAAHRRERIFIAAAHPPGPRPPRSRQAEAPQSRWPPDEPARRGLRLPAAHPSRQHGQRRGDSVVVAGPPGRAGTSPGDAAEHRDSAAAHPQGQRHRHDRPASRSGIRPTPVGGPAANTQGERCHQGVSPAGRLQRPPDPPRDGHTDWGPYQQAISRWENVLGRPAPQPTETGTRGQPRLSARFVEWLMGLPDGWVTDIDLPRTAHLRALGNGVVPQQAAFALGLLDESLRPGRPGVKGGPT